MYPPVKKVKTRVLAIGGLSAYMSAISAPQRKLQEVHSPALPRLHFVASEGEIVAWTNTPVVTCDQQKR